MVRQEVDFADTDIFRKAYDPAERFGFGITAGRIAFCSGKDLEYMGYLLCVL